MNRYSYNYNASITVMRLVKEICEGLNLKYTLNMDGTLIFDKLLEDAEVQALTERLRQFGITLNDKEDDNLINRIKGILKQSVQSEKFRSKKISALLSDELGYSYAYLSNLFSKATYTSIENFLILVKIEKAKELLMYQNMNLTEVAHQLDYSSVSHLSNQFKSITGLTVSQFLKHVKSRDN